VFSALDVCCENALYKFTFDIIFDIDIAAQGQNKSLSFYEKYNAHTMTYGIQT